MVDVPAIQALRANLLVSWLTLDFHNLWLTIHKHKYPLVISYIAIENDHRIYVDFPIHSMMIFPSVFCEGLPEGTWSYGSTSSIRRLDPCGTAPPSTTVDGCEILHHQKDG